MAELVLVPEQAAQREHSATCIMETLFHELSHSLGPGSITVGGRATTVDQELKEVGSGFEEAKADVMGAYNVLFMMDKGVLPAAEKPQIRASLCRRPVPGDALRRQRSARPGRGDAIPLSARQGRDRVGCRTPSASASTMPSSTPESATWSARSSGSRATGDYAGTKAFLAKWAVMDAEAKQVTGTMGHIPVDIWPIYPKHI